MAGVCSRVRVSRLADAADVLWVREACTAAGGSAATAVTDVSMAEKASSADSACDDGVRFAIVTLSSRAAAEEAKNKLDGERMRIERVYDECLDDI